MGCGVATAVLALSCVAVLVDAVLLDLELTKELEEVIKGDNFVLSMKHIKPKKRSRGLLETLFAVDFPGAHHKFSLLLDRKVNKVIVETSEDNKKRSQYFIVDSLHDESTIKSLILAVNQSQPGAHATLYLDCTSYGIVALPKTLRDMFSSMRHPKIEVYHERKYPVEIDGHRDLRMVLSRNECPLSLDTGVSSKFDGIFSDDFLSNGLNDDPNILSQQPQTLPYRGDIPMLPQLDDSGILTALNKLISVVNLEVKRCESTTQALEHLRHLIEECQACKGGASLVATCESHPPSCYPGVRCHNTLSGPTCGPCPRGYIGDGYRCTPGRTCADNPCFEGVQCRDTERGAECGRCPTGYEGNGQDCRRVCTENSCYPGVQCRVTSRGPECGSCPPGYEGDGRTCREGCTSTSCYPGVQCRVTSRGVECGPCPAGYEGDGRSCRSVCTPESCFRGVSCRPTARGPECGPCPPGYEGDGRTCTRRNPCQYPICAPGTNCVPTEESPFYACLGCPAGFTGNGSDCRDIDECDLFQPCDSRVTCHNLRPGFRCDPCPPGFTGSSGYQGVGVEDAQRKHQRCVDIDECAEGRVCVPDSECINIEGSYECGPCNPGFVGNQSMGCHHGEGYCFSGDKCDRQAECISLGWGQHMCKCLPGWAGNGIYCARDRDLDGWPDERLPCSDRFCEKDNCPYTPNSGQEDTDGDGLGNVCDSDADGDGVHEGDNCPLKPNPDQRDTDEGGPDKIGDICDNCPYVQNPDQSDVDNDGIGDACDDDMDNDRIMNEQDNCVLVPNADQSDSDGDGVGDVCDNCPNAYNPKQEDMDQNNVGDVCDSSVDSDRDGISDLHDNCRLVPNPNQLDTDRDGKGDACDNDIDDDGIVNNEDNCVFVYNPDQLDTNGNGYGDKCENDNDDDGFDNIHDVCPNNSLIYQTDFSKYQTVILDPEGETQTDPNWEIYNNGAEIVQTINSDPGLAVGHDKFIGVDFEGTFFVDTETDDDYVGFVFSYQNNRKFYTVMWKKHPQLYWESQPFRAFAEPGIQIKVVDSETGPGELLRNSLWHTGDTPNQVKLLWKDPRNQGWKEKTSYRWFLIHRPAIGLIRLKIFEGESMVTDSGNIFDTTHKGGRLGVFCFSQEMIIWSDLAYRCNDNVREEIWRELTPRLQKKVRIDNIRSYSVSPVNLQE